MKVNELNNIVHIIARFQKFNFAPKADFDALAALYDKDTIMSGPFKGVRAGGVISGGLLEVDETGYYWSATDVIGDTTAYSFSFDDYEITTYNLDNWHAFSVRCVAE